jgi:ferredoxin/flavodoxin---NADP+ reductase
MSAFYTETVLSVHHWTDRLFSFTTTRDTAFRFTSGQFAMIGLMVEGKPLLRAYSMVSAAYEEHLEFLSIKVQDGPLTSRLQHIKVGETIVVGRKATGTLLLSNLAPGKRLWLFGTGTGLAPFMSLARDPETYERFETVILVHGCRLTSELAYRDYLTGDLRAHELLGEMVSNQLVYHPLVTREAFANQGRITDLFESGQLFSGAGQPPFSLADDRFMLCGSPELLTDMKRLFDARGMEEGSQSGAGHYVVERAFVEK